MKFCDDFNCQDHAQICFDVDTCPLCDALHKIDDLEYDSPYYRGLIKELTFNLDKHPDKYEGYCACKFCRETGNYIDEEYAFKLMEQSNDDELFKAVEVDITILSKYWVSVRIRKAQLSNESEFLKKLGNVILKNADRIK